MSDKRRKYREDVLYEEYCRGLPEGSLTDDRIDDAFDDGVSAESLVNREVQHQNHVRLERLRQEEQWNLDRQHEDEDY